MSAPRRFVIVFVVDGLRPDAITPEDTPTLFRLRAEGVQFTNSHAVFPTVTRVNAATIAGMQPGTHGIVGNQIYVPAVDPQRAFDTGNFKNLRSRGACGDVRPHPWSDKGLYVDYALSRRASRFCIVRLTSGNGCCRREADRKTIRKRCNRPYVARTTSVYKS